MAEFGDCTFCCPACDTPITLPLTQTGADLTSITLAIDLNPVRQHIATQHPQEHPMSAILDDLKHVVTALEDEGHALAGKARSVLGHYEQEAAAVVDGVKPILADLRTGITADVKAVLADEMKVVTEVKVDTQQIIKDVVAEITKLLKTQPNPPAAS